MQSVERGNRRRRRVRVMMAGIFGAFGGALSTASMLAVTTDLDRHFHRLGFHLELFGADPPHASIITAATAAADPSINFTAFLLSKSASTAPDNIPPLLHFVWVSQPSKIASENNTVTESVQSVVESWKAIYPEYTTVLWDNFLARRVFAAIIPTLAKCENAAHISDVLRYAILAKFGGLYVDTDTIAMRRLPEWLFDKSTGAFSICQLPFTTPTVGEIVNKECNETANGIIGARPGHPALRGILSTALNAVKTHTPNPNKKGLDVYFFASSGPPGWTIEAKKHGVIILHSHTFFPCHWTDKKSCVMERFQNDSGVYAMHTWAQAWLDGLPKKPRLYGKLPSRITK
mmetsp:Transcript_30272/g.66569  ORF Transcript_30272/g.66569 Transcript_30272/m.66569 type:complete len:346 (-) Transcript_30272:2039-3076(-)|eukprot:CAMPEP_0178546008 /NCGR_PEP_ID=MMETSP0697-20121206/3935_2 /TAXON_ID=265572 /ORGANISM="Extubocellulus spinifer, Strain CCMP396" /LENGTH=345 /DNA_ID=CAMNT_0020178591 /DNA_START=38 /DNA_END=1075 /DNA_ORIENTATION=-